MSSKVGKGRRNLPSINNPPNKAKDFLGMDPSLLRESTYKMFGMIVTNIILTLYLFTFGHHVLAIRLSEEWSSMSHELWNDTKCYLVEVNYKLFWIKTPR